jgi:HEAT repeat protein
MDKKPDLDVMLDGENVSGLEEALRWPDDAQLRAAAARALGELADGAAAESLALSAWLDPEPMVQKAARAALDVLLGENDARNMLEMYRGVEPEDDDWLRVDPEAEEEMAWTGEHEIAWVQDDVTGLISVLRGEPSPELRVRAARALTQFPSPEVVEALVDVCLHSDHPHVRAVCREALIEIYGDDAADVIASYRTVQTQEYDGEEVEDEEDDGSWDKNDEDQAG